MLPSRLRESAFRKYEETIRTIVQEYPAVVQVSLNGLATVTVAGRLRDAMASLYKYRWQTDISMGKFLEVYPTVIVTHRGTALFAGSKEELNRLNPTMPAVATPVRLGLTPVQEEPAILDETQLAVICDLVAKRQLASFTFKWNGELLDTQIKKLEENYDIRIDKGETTGTYVIS